MTCPLSYRLVLFFLLASPLMRAQTLPYRRILITKVGETSLVSVNDLAEDDRGFLWLGGLYGLYKYDGVYLNIFSNRPNDTTSLTPGPYIHVKKSKHGDGLWLGSNTGGVSYFDLQTERAVNYTADPDDPGALAGNDVAGLFEDTAGGLWVGTNQFTLHYLPPSTKAGETARKFQRFRPPLPDGVALDFASAGGLGEIVPDLHQPDILWIGSRYGVYRFSKTNHSFHLFPLHKEVVFWYRPLPMQVIMDQEGYIWFGGSITGLCRLDPSTGQWRTFLKGGQAPEVRNANTILDIATLDDSTLLVCTASDDAWRVNWKRQTVEFLAIGVAQSPGQSYPMSSINHTRNGDLLIPYTQGLIRLTKRKQPWPAVYFPSLNPTLDRNNWQRAYTLSPDRQSLFLGTLRGNGLLVYGIKTGQIDAISYRALHSAELADVLMDALIFDSTGRLWIGTDTGLLFLKNKERRIRRFSGDGPAMKQLADAHVAALAADDHTLWIGTKGRGLFRLELSSNTLQPVAAVGLNTASNVNCLLPDKLGRLWIGHDRGLTVIDLITAKSRHFSRQNKPPRGLNNDQVTSLACDAAGHLWISTLGGGMLRLRNGDPDKPYFDFYINDNDLPGGNLVYEFVVGDHGQLWLGTQTGLAVLDTASRTFVNYDYRDGMMAKIGAMIRLPDGRIVSGIHRGFHIFHPDSVMRLEPPPIPYLKRFRVFDKEVNLPKQIDLIEELSLAHNQNHFSFELGALNFGETARTHFAYRLDGYDQDWVYSGSRDYIAYTNLPAGAYTLRVKAANKHGLWSGQEKSIRIHIHPAYWQQWWFRLGVLLLLFALAYVVLLVWRQRQRVRQAQNAVAYFTQADYRQASVRDILWDVAHKCIARLGLEECVIYLLDESGEYLVQEAAYGAKSPELYQLIDPLRIPLGQGIVGAAGLLGQPQLIPDTRLDRRYIVDDQPRLSELAVPILHDGRVIGVIDSEHSKRGFFTPHHVEVLKTVAALCADKIAQARIEELVREKERQVHELNRSLAESQLTALRAQMNPHFLFNSLNSINWYIIKNRPAEASRYIAKFSRLIRLILEYSKCRQITLTQELDALRLYLDMESMRFDQRFEYQIDISPGVDPEELMVPPLIFQPYVENAIWHGLMPKDGPGRVWLTLREEADRLVCIIEDNGIGRAAAAANANQQTLKRQSQGLKITEARIRQANGQPSGTAPVQFMDLYDAAGQAAGTRVEIWL